MDKTLERIMNSDNWPSIRLPDNLEILNEMADKCYLTGTFEGMLSGTLMYHQILEAMCIHIIEDCNFFIQLSVYPSQIDFKVPEDRMFGYYIGQLKSSVSFLNKNEFIEKTEVLNFYRKDVVHKMRKSNLPELALELKKVKDCFDSIYNLYNEIQDNFRVTFHSLQKDIFIVYLSDEEYNKCLRSKKVKNII